LILGHTAAEAFDLSKVLFIPCSTPPHKRVPNLLSARHRMAMLEAAVEGDLLFETSDIETRRGGISYAIDTVSELRRMYPQSELYFIIGSDMLRELHLWKKINDLLTLCQFAVFGRPAGEAAPIQPENLKLDPPWGERLVQNIRPGRLVEISSSDIRHRQAEGMSIRYLVPFAVEMYIAEHRLYSG